MDESLEEFFEKCLGELLEEPLEGFPKECLRESLEEFLENILKGPLKKIKKNLHNLEKKFERISKIFAGVALKSLSMLQLFPWDSLEAFFEGNHGYP